MEENNIVEGSSVAGSKSTDSNPVDNGWRKIFGLGARHDVGQIWTPERFRVALVEYFQFSDANPWSKDVKVSSKVTFKNGVEEGETKRTVVRPYTMKSMCARIGINDWDKFKTRYCDETTEEGREFGALCSAVENFISGYQQEGGLNGILNAKLVQAINDIADHVKTDVSGMGDKSDEDLEAELERMRKSTEQE